MAEIVEEALGEIEAVEQKLDTKTEVAQEAVEQKPELPEKYRGKSVEDIVKMHQEAEKLIGTKANEVSEMRRLADELLKARTQQEKPKQEVQEVDFFENPEEAVKRAIENNPKLVQTEQILAQLSQDRARQAFQQKHPDGLGIVQSPEFQEWVKASSIRSQLFKQADAYDVAAADELLSTYKELRNVRAVNQQEAAKEVDIAEKATREKTMKAAFVDSGGSGEVTKKVYKRTELMNMMLRNPAGYAELSDSGELAAAYREGRVK